VPFSDPRDRLLSLSPLSPLIIKAVMGMAVDPFDPEHLRLSGYRVETPVTKRLKAKRKRRFALGPIPWSWWTVCDAAAPHALSIALGILMETCRPIGRPLEEQIVVAEAFGRQLGLSPPQRRRAIAGLEAAGLIEVERKPNHAPRVRLVPWRGKSDG
jgi:hypothetical protein